jgi:hypothetical protein
VTKQRDKMNPLTISILRTFMSVKFPDHPTQNPEETPTQK